MRIRKKRLVIAVSILAAWTLQGGTASCGRGDDALARYEAGDYINARRYAWEAARKGDVLAQFVLARNGDDSKGPPKGWRPDDAEIGKMFQTALLSARRLADKGDPRSQYVLGWMSHRGKGMPRDDVKAVEWLRKSAKQGYAAGQNALGTMYVEGAGVAKDAAEAFKWRRKAAEQGFAPAQYALGWMHHNGTGVSRNDAEAVKWYRKAAEQRHAPAQYALGWMHRNGTGASKIDAEAAKWYRKAAEQGHVPAQYALGWMYANGRGVLKDEIEADKWYRKAERMLPHDEDYWEIINCLLYYAVLLLLLLGYAAGFFHISCGCDAAAKCRRFLQVWACSCALWGFVLIGLPFWLWGDRCAFFVCPTLTLAEWAWDMIPGVLFGVLLGFVPSALVYLVATIVPRPVPRLRVIPCCFAATLAVVVLLVIMGRH